MRIILKFILLGLFINSTIQLQAQKYTSEKSLVSFFSDAPLEDISARNTKSLAIIDLASNQVAFSIPITGFEFEKSLMQEHFNEKYLESEKYPKSTFQAQLAGFNPKEKGIQNVTTKGKLTMHGVTKEVEIPGTIELTSDKKIIIKSTFMVRLADYKIEIPQLVFQKIAEVVEVKVDFTLSQK